jgi:hypothetical protein
MYDLERLEDDYCDWLTENCKCVDDACECSSFEEWIENLKEFACEGLDEQDYEEMYG